MKLSTILLALAITSAIAVAEPGEIVNISTAAELIQFSKNVNAGTDYYGMTVLLTDDIDFTGGLSSEFSPISITAHMFIGTFDGQGHTIRNLEIKSTRSFVGLFGIIAQGATVKNVVMDSSCSISNTCDDEYIGTVGSIAGACATYSIGCKLLNNVNMAKVTFAGSTNDCMYIGGIIGYAKPVTHLVTMHNNVNYGDVEMSGTNAVTATIGGIIGECFQTEVNPVRCNIKNNANFGAVSHTGKTSMYMYFGGAVGGYENENYLYNLVSAGKVSSNKGKNFVGSLVGLLYGYSNMTNCYFDSTIGYDVFGLNYGKSGIKEIYPFDPESLILGNKTKHGDNAGEQKVLTEALNEWVMKAGTATYSLWGLNRKQYVIKFIVNNKHFVTFSSKFFMVPNIDAEGFEGWFMDPTYKYAFDPAVEITQNTILYAKFSEF